MSDFPVIERNNGYFRDNNYGCPPERQKWVDLVREEYRDDGTTLVIEARLPYGVGWNSGNGVIDWLSKDNGPKSSKWFMKEDYYTRQKNKDLKAQGKQEAKK